MIRRLASISIARLNAPPIPAHYASLNVWHACSLLLPIFRSMRNALAFLLLALVLGLLGCLTPTTATHIAFGTVSWTKVTGYANRLSFNIEMALRTSFDYTSFNSKGDPYVGCINIPPIYYQGSYGVCYAVYIPYQQVYPADDWFSGRRTMVMDLPQTSAGRAFTATISKCCRLSTLLEENQDKYFYIRSVVNTNQRTASPITTGMPREFFQLGKPVSFRIPAVSTLGNTMTYALATTEESALTIPVPCGQNVPSHSSRCDAARLRVDSTTGAFTWTPNVAGLYAVQVRITEGPVATYLDFIMEVLADCSENCNNPPYFSPVPPAVVTVYTGTAFTFDISAKDDDVIDTVTITTSVLPDGATFVEMVPGNPTTWRLSWAPTIDQTSVNICFKARDSRGSFSVGNQCVLFQIQQSDFILVTGIIRDFRPTHADFNKTTAQTYSNFVRDTLGTDEKPVYVGPAPHASGVTAASFSDWYHDKDGVNLATLYTITLVQGSNTHSSKRVFSLFDSLFYPIDGRLFNDGVSGRNQFFTYEVHTYIEYLGGETYTFRASDDMWVFLENKLVTANLVGTRAVKSQTVNMDVIAPSLSLERGSNYKVDLFYSHRSTLDPYLGVELSNSSSCSAISLLNADPALLTLSTPLKFETFAASDASFLRFLGKADSSALAGGNLRIISQASPSESGAVWAAEGNTPTLFKVLNGFLATFSFVVTKPTGGGAEGFAFVLQADSPSGRGTEGANLGYSGLRNSLAIEFDMTQNTGKSDPAFQHISLHTAYAGVNDALESSAYYPAGSTYAGNLPNLPFTFDNGTRHDVRIEFLPAPSATWVRVYVNANIRPLYEAQLDTAKLNTIFANGAYMGFTAANSDSRVANIDITKWTAVIVPALASKSRVVAAPPLVVAGQDSFVDVQLRDACDNAVSAAGESSRFTAFLEHSYVLEDNAGTTRPLTVAVAVSDIGSGQYRFTYRPTRAGNYNLRILYATKGTPELIGSGVVTVAVVPGAASAVESSYEYGAFPVVADSGSAYADGLVCAAFDTATNLPAIPSGVPSATALMRFAATPAVTFKAWFESLPATTVISCAVKRYFSATASTSSALRNQILAAFPSAGASTAFKLVLSSYSDIRTGFAFIGRKTSATEGTLADSTSNIYDMTKRLTFEFNVSDGSDDKVTMVAQSASATGGSFCYLQAIPSVYRVRANVRTSFMIIARDAYRNLKTNADTTSTFTYRFTPTLPGTVEAPAYAAPGYSSAYFLSTTTGVFSVNLRLNGLNVGADFNVNFEAGPAHHTTSIATGADRGGEAGSDISFQLQLRDVENNAVISHVASDIVTGTATLSSNKDVSVPMSFTWNKPAARLDVKYSSTVAGVYSLKIIINNGNHTGTDGLLVTIAPGPFNAAKSVVYSGTSLVTPPQATANVGAQYRTMIQSRDQYCNSRSDNDLGVATLDVAGFPTAPTVNYEADGRFYYDWQVTWPLTTPDRTVSVAAGAAKLRVGAPNVACADAGTQDFVVSGRPGPIGQPSTLAAPTSQPASDTFTLTYKVTMRDTQGNLRVTTATEAAEALSVQMTGVIGNNLITAQTKWGSCDDTAHTCDLLASATVSGTYRIVIRIAATGELITDDGSDAGMPGQEALVTYLATEPSKCTTDGDLSGGAGTLTVYVTDRDKFSNIRSLDADKHDGTAGFTLVLATKTTGAPKQMTYVSAGRYTVSFTGPLAEDVNNNTYLMRFHFNSGAAFATSEATVPEDDKCYARVMEGSTTTPSPLAIAGAFSVGSEIVLHVRDFNAEGVARTSSLTLSFVGSSGDDTPNPVPFTTSSSSTSSTNEFVFRFTVFQAGRLSFMLRWGNLVSNVHGSSPYTPYTLTVSPGAMYAPASSITNLANSYVAGANNIAFSIIPRDQYSYDITVNPNVSPIATVSISGVSVGSGATFTWNASTKQLDVKITTTRAGLATLDVVVNSLSVGGRTYALRITPAAFSAPHSRVSGTQVSQLSFPTLARAGTAYPIFLFANDAYDNQLTATAAIETALNVGGTDVTSTFTFVASNIFQTTYTFVDPTNPTGVAVYVGDSANSGYVRVRSGVPDAARTTAASTEFADKTTSVDSDVTIVINVRDVNNKPWVANPITLANDRLLVSALLKNSGGKSTVIPVTQAADTLGRYTLTIAASLYRAAGAYSISLNVENINIATVALTVEAGVTDPARTIVSAFAAPYKSNTEGTVRITLRDRFDNYVNRDNGEETLNVAFIRGSLVCNAHTHAEEDVPEHTIANFVLTQPVWTPSPDPGDADASYYTLTYRALESGYFTMLMNVTINVDSAKVLKQLSCSQQQAYTLEAQPGEPDAAFTTYELQGTTNAAGNLIAGNTYTFFIQLKDSLGQNVTLPWDDIVVLGQHSSKQADWLNVDNDDSGTPKADALEYIDYFKQGIYSGQIELRFRPRRAHVNYVVFLGLGATNGPRITPNGPQTLTVEPGAPFSVGIPASIPAATAGQPTLFVGHITDKYANAITSVDTASAPLITALLTRQQSTIASPAVLLDLHQITPLTTTKSTGEIEFSYTPVWEGNYAIAVVLRTSTGIYLDEATGSVVINHATCAFATPATPYRCPSASNTPGTCVASQNLCTGTAACSGSTPVTCPNGACVASVQLCACPSGVRCANGACASTAADCLDPSPCPAGQVACMANNAATGECRLSAADCPTVGVCPRGLIVCPNSLSCALDIASCSQSTTTCAFPQKSCPDGRCARFMDDCATAKTCPAGKVLCLTDYSCQDSANHCPSQYKCNDPTSKRCWTGDCRANFGDCPSRVTCPVGQVLCEDNSCASSLAQCAAKTTCPLAQVTCPDGTCAENILLCPSQITCPTATPVLCSDRSCKVNVAECVQPQRCPTGATTCPDGSCAQGTPCPSVKTCPAEKPVLCSDRSCAASASGCTTVPECPTALPFSCPDGSCRATLTDCPSRTICAVTSPIRCADDTCQQSQAECPTQITNSTTYACPSGYVTCAGGECAKSLVLCPTHVTCPLGSIKCADGRCARASECPSKDASENCATRGLIQCPVAASGIACAAALADCPTGLACPVDTPVRCLDATCAAALSQCPALPTDTANTNRKPCPDGSWTLDSCPSAVSCPTSAPYKCYDQSCRPSASDCPVAGPCGSATPYRCSNGACSARPWACTAAVDGVCDPQSSTPIKCPLVDGTAKCAAKLDDCTSSFDNDPTGERLYCPAGFTRCRDGSCSETATACAAYSCPRSFPTVCPNGSCVKTAAECPLENGCPTDAPIKCPGVGVCRARLAMCPASTCPALGLLSCPDGSCSTTCPRRASGCRSGTVRCADGTCVSDYAQCTSKENLANSCPGNRPIRCSNGLCVAARSACPVLDNTLCTDLTKPVQCADGQCRASSDLCTVIAPCATAGYVRCDDGSCMDASSDANVCSNLNTCPTGMVRCKQSSFLSISILDGLCAPSLGECYSSNGCPMKNMTIQTRCDNGRCVVNTSGGPDQCSAGVILANGCSSTSPFKCWNGECTANAASCRATNGCDATTPYRCPNGSCVESAATCAADGVCTGITCADGACVTEQSQCDTLVGCSIATPVRCADGSCRKYPATYRALLHNATLSAADMCTPVVSCPSSAYTRCENGDCVADKNDCGAVKYDCAAATPFRCPSDGSCVADPSTCTTRGTCPAASPILCPNGACVKSIVSCPTSTDPKRTVLSGPSTRPSCEGKPVTCFDGSCRATYSECINWATAAETASTACDGVRCSDGACLPASSAASCPVIDACPIGHYRCFDGTCSTTACAAAPACTGENQIRCADGVCRPSGTCPAFDGCPVTSHLSYFCPNRECAAGPDGCDAAATIDPDQRALERIAEGARMASVAAAAAVTSGFTDLRASAENVLRGMGLRDVAARMDAARAADFARALAAKDTAALAAAFVTLAHSDSTARACTSDCYASFKVNTTSFVYDPSESSQEYLVAPAVTSFRVRAFSGMQVDSTRDLTLYFTGVPESTMADGTNKVTYSRIETFGRAMTFAQTVLSPAISCRAGDGIVEPFEAPLLLQANIDRTVSPAYEDVCLARLRRFPELNYEVWECLFTEAERTSGDTAYSVKADPSVQPNLVSSYITTCSDPDAAGSQAIYAFIHSPTASSQVYTRSTDTFWRDNVVWIMLGIAGGLLLLAGIIYTISRLTRYSGKLEKAKVEVAALETEVATMEQHGGQTGRKDDQVMMTANPLAIQLETLQKKFDDKDRELQQERNMQLAQKSAERQIIIEQLAAETEKNLAELERMKARLNATTGAATGPTRTVAPPVAPQQPASVAYAVSSPTVGPQSSPIAGPLSPTAYAAMPASPMAPPKRRDL